MAQEITYNNWVTIYNNVFKLFPPPDIMIEKIILKNGSMKKEFNTFTEMLIYMTSECMKNNDSEMIDICDDDISYVLRNNDFKTDIDKEINEIIKKIKARK